MALADENDHVDNFAKMVNTLTPELIPEAKLNILTLVTNLETGSRSLPVTSYPEQASTFYSNL